jgi:hypothetical protein
MRGELILLSGIVDTSLLILNNKIYFLTVNKLVQIVIYVLIVVLSVEIFKALKRIHVRNRIVVGFSSTKLMGIDEDSHDSNPHKERQLSLFVFFWVFLIFGKFIIQVYNYS